MTDAEILTALAPVAESLMARHLAAAKEWFPHELVPWERAGRSPEWPLPDGVRSALVVNLLTEDNLPFYVAALNDRLGGDGVWNDWIRRWTAEEMRHAIVIRDYVTVTSAVDLVDLERTRLQHVWKTPVPTAPNALEALVYVALQELATRVAHGNTGRALDDTAGQAIMRRVAADENLHHLFYRDLVHAALDLTTDQTVMAIEAQARHFAMPGAAIPDFADHAEAIANAGIYSAAMFHDQVLLPVLVSHWRLDQLQALSTEGEQARDRIFRFIDRLGRLVDRLPGAST